MQFEIDSSCEYLLLEKQQLKWKVQERDKTNLATGVGPELLVPSLFFFVHWLTDDAESIQRLIGRVRDTFAACVVALNLQLGKLLQDAQVRTAFPVRCSVLIVSKSEFRVFAGLIQLSEMSSGLVANLSDEHPTLPRRSKEAEQVKSD